MKKLTFKQKAEEVRRAGFHLDKEYNQGHRYNVWFNSPSGSKEIFCRNFTEIDQGLKMLQDIREEEKNK